MWKGICVVEGLGGGCVGGEGEDWGWGRVLGGGIWWVWRVMFGVREGGLLWC